MSPRLRWVLIGGCALLGLLDGPTAGALLAQGLDGAYADEAAARPTPAAEPEGAVLPEPHSAHGRAGDGDPRAGRLIELELSTWRGGLASGL